MARFQATDDSTKEDNNSTNKSANDAPITQCFIILQSRNLAKPLPSVGNLSALCPSMDLIALGLGSAASKNKDEHGATVTAVENVHIHRTVSWQRLLVLGPSELSGSTVIAPHVDFDDLTSVNDKLDNNGTQKRQDRASDNSIDLKGATCIAWSADGRALAIGLANGRVLLYQIESTGARLVHATARATFYYRGNSSTETSGKNTLAVESSSLPAPRSTPRTAPSPVLTRSRAAAIRRQQLLRQQNRQQYQQQQQQEEEKSQKVTTGMAATKDATEKTAVGDMYDTNMAAPQVVGLCWTKRVVHPQQTRKTVGDVDEEEMDEAWM